MGLLRQKFIKSVKWNTLQTVLVGVLGLVLQITKANFLTPAEFGALAIILIFIGLFKVLENFGISQAVIQRDAIDKQEASSIFFFNIFITLVMGAVLFAASPFIAVFFSIPALESYLRVTSLIVIIGGPTHLFRGFLEKNFLFKQLSVIEIIRSVLTFVLIFWFLYMGYGVFGIIFGYFIADFINTIILVTVGMKNKVASISLYFNFKKLYPFLKFGFLVSAKEVATYSTNRVDQVIIGYFFDPDILGIYYFGKNLLEILRHLITSTFSKVLFPAFSQLKNNLAQASKAYYKVTMYMCFISFPVFTGISLTAHLFVPLVFGEQWSDSILVFQIFSLALLVKVLSASISTSLLYAFNKPLLVLMIDLISSVMYITTLVLFAEEGMLAVLILYSLYAIYKGLPQIYYANKVIDSNLFLYFKNIIPTAGSTFIMALGVLMVQRFTQNMYSDLLQLCIAVFTGVFIYVLLGFLLQRKTFNNLLSMLKVRKFA